MKSFLIVLSLGACSAGALFMPMAMPGVAMPASGPSHPPTTDAQWTTAETEAAAAATAAGAEQLAAPSRVRQTGFLATHHVALEGGRCYHAGVAWSYDEQLETSYSYDPGTNISLAGTGKRLDPPRGALDFCADHVGGVTLTFTAISRSGALANNELLEVAVVVGSTKETASARTTRRANEAKLAVRAREAEAASNCAECSRKYSDCRAHGFDGFDCHQAFEQCASENDTIDTIDHPRERCN